MQVYRGMDIGTAKPGLEERRRVPHHLIDVLGLNEGFDAAQFIRLARAAQAAIESRGKTAVYCGGTGLYFKALLEGLRVTRRRAIHRCARTWRPGPGGIIGGVAKPRSCRVRKNGSPESPACSFRALEVIRLTGKPFSAQQSPWQKSSAGVTCRLVGLRRTQADLRERIDGRVAEMLHAASWRKPARCSTADWPPIPPPCRRSDTARWSSICAANARFRKPLNW